MLRGIYTSASGMIVQSERQDIISNNLANVSTTGFKKDETIIKKFPEFDIYRKDDEKEITPFENKSILTKIGKLGTGAMVKDSFTEFDQGTIVETGNKLDFAIQGEGFFAVETKQGIKLSRSGNFSLNNENLLVTSNGDKVLGIDTNGKVGYIKSTENSFDTGKGGILINAEIAGDIKLESKIKKSNPENMNFLSFNIKDKENLVKEGDNYYSIKGVKDINVDLNVLFKQNFLENSNVNIVKEMVSMIECTRAYETNQKILTSQDEVLNKVVNEVGKWG